MKIIDFIYSGLIAEDLQKENAFLREENERLRCKNQTLHQENARLKEELEKSLRRGARQAAPFSKDEGVKSPKTPGRKRGEGYGRRYSRPIPEHIDRVIDVEIKTGLTNKDGMPICPDCCIELEDKEVRVQYQTDIPVIPKPIITQFNIETAKCPCCDRHFQGRHPEQASDALGAASNQLGPRLLAIAAQLKYDYGLSFGKIKSLILDFFGIIIGRATPARSAQRIASKAEPTYLQLILRLQGSNVVCVDETGWRIGRTSCWLWVFTDKTITVYVIDLSRGHEVVERVLGEKFEGTLSSDGFLAYDAVEANDKQQCNAHLLKACSKIEAIKSRGAVCFSRQVASVLRAGINA